MLQRPVFFVRLLHGRGVCRLASPSTVAACISGVADICSQLILEQREQLDRCRLAVCTALGGMLDGALVQRWYQALHGLRGPHIVPRRMLLHQFLFTPTLLPAYIAATVLLEGRVGAWQKVQQEWRPAVCAHWLFVAPLQATNALAVPKQFQVLFANSCAFLWSMGFSWLCHRSVVTHEARSSPFSSSRTRISIS
jgi:hypothetical protein